MVPDAYNDKFIFTFLQLSYIINVMLDVLTDADYELFRKVIYDESGITFSATNRSILDSRIKEMLRKKNLNTPQEYYALISKDPEEMKIMLDAVTTNLTRFFRNQPHFDSFVNYVIPHVIEHKKSSGGDRTIKIWSAGCSTGEEPYTIAMIMKEICPPDFNFQITASDISLKSIMTAQQGFYPDARVDGVPENYLELWSCTILKKYKIFEGIVLFH